jgi:hypothetical protein
MSQLPTVMEIAQEINAAILSGKQLEPMGGKALDNNGNEVEYQFGYSDGKDVEDVQFSPGIAIHFDGEQPQPITIKLTF